MLSIMKNKKILCSVCFLFAFVSVLWGQNITVKGNVTSKTDALRLFAGGGCGRDRRGVRPQFYHQVCFDCGNPVYLL